MNIKTLTICALSAAIMCICGPLSVPIGPVPVSLTNLIICFEVMILGTRKALAGYAVYILIGIIGFPVFSGFQGGLAKVAGPTGGYLVGFFLMILIGGFVMERAKGNLVVTGIGMILGTAVCYIFGTAWFMFIMNCEPAQSLALCVWPFVPFDLMKIAVAVPVGKIVRKRLVTAGVIINTSGGE